MRTLAWFYVAHAGRREPQARHEAVRRSYRIEVRRLERLAALALVSVAVLALVVMSRLV